LIALLLKTRVECAAIERPDGLLVGRLLAAGIVVLAIHPNQVKAARERYRAAAGKNDRFDAFVLAELARTDRHRFPVLAPSGDETLALKTLVRTREELVDARVALANQLRAQLQTFWAGAERIFADIDSPIGLAFLQRYPSPTDTRGLGEKRLGGFLARHAYCGRRTPAELLARLRRAPAVLAPGLAPRSTSAWRTQPRSVSAEQPSFAEIEQIAAHSVSYSVQRSSTSRTPRSRTSTGYLVTFPIGPSSGLGLQDPRGGSVDQTVHRSASMPDRPERALGG
jgi:hypothetical protein